MDFGRVYGDEFGGLIHVHHVQPLAAVGTDYLIDPIEHLRPICPNCHAMVHHGNRLRDISEVQGVLQAAAAALGETS
jgi:5-methylcytosine-specific restriction protein A